MQMLGIGLSRKGLMLFLVSTELLETALKS